jgi:hypothetical protein
MTDQAMAERASLADDEARLLVVRSASEEPYRRRPSDYLRLVAAVVGCAHQAPRGP